LGAPEKEDRAWSGSHYRKLDPESKPPGWLFAGRWSLQIRLAPKILFTIDARSNAAVNPINVIQEQEESSVSSE
jgi:hypothetical protein